MRTQIQNRIANFKETADAFRGEKTEWHKHQVNLLEAKIEQLEWALSLINAEQPGGKEKALAIAQKYLGMTPKDLGCESFAEMNEKLANEILDLK